VVKEKARLTGLADRLAGKPKGVAAAKGRLSELVANPPHGQKGDFVKVTVTLPPDVYMILSQEVTRRKLAKEPNPRLSAIIREAVVAYLEGE
jgi:transcriptional regulator of met regulon